MTRNLFQFYCRFRLLYHAEIQLKRNDFLLFFRASIVLEKFKIGLFWYKKGLFWVFLGLFLIKTAPKKAYRQFGFSPVVVPPFQNVL